MAFISDYSELDVNVVIGIHSVIEKNVKIGKNCVIGSNVIIKEGTEIGENVRIDDNAVIGKRPMKASLSATTDGEKFDPAVIKDSCIIGTNSVIYRGSVIEEKTMIADLATVRENVTVGTKSIIGRNVAIENKCKIGKKCKIETNAYITAFSTVEDYCFIAPGVNTSNDNYVGRTEKRFDEYKGITVKKGGRIGLNATILPGIVIGEDALVGAGAVVTRDVPTAKIVIGNPAKVYKDVPGEQLLENQS